MGGAVSAGVDNDDLIDNLIKANYIRTPMVERVFRSVDRAFYFLPERRRSAYRDLAWKHGNLHLSAPCIYSEVMEQLDLKPGLSFLNIGSGTGYLSTMVGLILGTYGINHGIEIYSDVVEYANEKLEQFKKTCNGVDVFEFCEPHFIVGNGFDMNPDRKYDRIYCGAACPEAYHEHIKRFLKVGGVLVMPCEDDLLKIIRSSVDTWEIKSVLPVSFSTLQLPDSISNTALNLDANPLDLQALCRMKIRSTLRLAAEKKNPELAEETFLYSKEKSENYLVIPLFVPIVGNEDNDVSERSNEDSDVSDVGDEDNDVSDDELCRSSDGSSHNTENQSFDRTISKVDNISGDLSRKDEYDTIVKSSPQHFEKVSLYCDVDNGDRNKRNDDECSRNVKLVISRNSAEKEEPSEYQPASHVTSDIIKNAKNYRCSNEERNALLHVTNVNEAKNDIDNDKTLLKQQVSETENMKNIPNVKLKLTSYESAQKSVVDVKEVNEIGKKKIRRKFESSSVSVERAECIKKLGNRTKTNDANRENVVNKKAVLEAREENVDVEGEKDNHEEMFHSQPKKLLKREKLDSGISEESDDGKISPQSDESSYSDFMMLSEPMEIESLFSEFVYDSSSTETNENDFEYENEKYLSYSIPENNRGRTISLKYRMIMENKIQTLPLPRAVKLYLNYDREFTFL